MKFTFDTDEIVQNGLDYGEFCVLLGCYLGKSIEESTIRSLGKKGLLGYNDVTDKMYPSDFFVTKEGTEMLEGILADTKLEKKKIDRFDSLAEDLINIFPKGRKEGTNYLWRDSKLSIARRLKTLVVKYKVDFTDEAAIKATKSYVESFNGCYRTMRLLKYFIFKVEVKDGHEEFTSELLARIENQNQIDEERTDWLATLK